MTNYPPMPERPPQQPFDAFAPRQPRPATGEAQQFQYADTEPAVAAPNMPPEAPGADSVSQNTPPETTWESVLKGSQSVPREVLGAYHDRKNAKKELDEYDDDGRLIVSEAKRDLEAVTPDMVIVGIVRPKRWEEVKNAARNPKPRNILAAAKSLLPGYVREETWAVGWKVARTVGDVPAKKADSSEENSEDSQSADTTDQSAEWFSGRVSRAREEQDSETDTPEDDESKKLKELVILTSDRELLRFEGTDETPEDSGMPLRFAHVYAPDYGDSEKGAAKEEKALAEAKDYLERNQRKFTTMRFVGAAALSDEGPKIKNMDNALAAPGRVKAGIARLFENATGMQKVED